MSIASTIRELESGHSRVLTEMQHGGTIQLVADFIETAEPLLCDIKDAYNTAKVSLFDLLDLQFLVFLSYFPQKLRSKVFKCVTH